MKPTRSAQFLSAHDSDQYLELWLIVRISPSTMAMNIHFCRFSADSAQKAVGGSPVFGQLGATL